MTLGGLLRTGRYTVHVAVETATGAGPLSAPLSFSLAAVSAQSPPLPRLLLASRWFQAALAALLSLLLLVLTAVLLACLYRRRRGRTLTRGEAQ